MTFNRGSHHVIIHTKYPLKVPSVSTGEGFRQRCRQLQNVTPQQDVMRGEAARLKEVEPSKFR